MRVKEPRFNLCAMFRCIAISFIDVMLMIWRKSNRWKWASLLSEPSDISMLYNNLLMKALVINATQDTICCTTRAVLFPLCSLNDANEWMNEYRLDFPEVVKQLVAKKKVKAKNLVMTFGMCLDKQLSIHMLMKNPLRFDEICLVIDTRMA